MAKLNYLQMLGYDISWAGFNIIEVISWCRCCTRRKLSIIVLVLSGDE